VLYGVAGIIRIRSARHRPKNSSNLGVDLLLNADLAAQIIEKYLINNSSLNGLYLTGEYYLAPTTPDFKTIFSFP
jgi:hypothetical protein